ncbi:MAG: complex I subunit 5 family protein [Spirochaetaceae bacterium]
MGNFPNFLPPAAAAAELPVILLLLAPLAASIVSMCGKLIHKRAAVLPAFLVWSLGTGWALFASAPAVFEGKSLLYALGGWAEPFGIVMELNGASWAAGVTSLVLGTAIWLQTFGNRNYTSFFYSILYLTFFSLQGVLCTRDLFNLFVWFEILSLCSFVLMAYDKEIESLTAALRYLFMSTVSIIFFLLGLWIFYRYSGTLSLETIAAYLLEGDISRRAAGLATAAVAAGILTRSAIIPFHTWLPYAHAAAPHPVSALLSGFVIKAPVFALWHFTDYISFSGLGELLIWLGAGSAVVGGWGAAFQRDAKKVLAYSSIGQMGYIVAAFGIGGELGKTAALYSIAAHALYKGLLFLVVGETTHRVGCRSVHTVRGLGRLFPFHTFMFALGAVSIMGIPLFAGYGAKHLLSISLYNHPAGLLVPVAGAGTAAALFKLSRMFTGTPSEAIRIGYSKWNSGARLLESPFRGSFVFPATGLLVLASGCIVLGISPESVLGILLPLVEREDPAAFLTQLSKIEWFALGGLLKTAGTIAAAALLYTFLQLPPGRAVEARLAEYRVSLNGSLRLLILGSLLFFLFGAFYY